ARQVALSYVGFAQQSARLTEEELIETHQELILQGIDARTGAALAMLEAARLLRRHGQEVLGGMTAAIAAHSEALAKRTLPDDGLLRLYLADADRPRPAEAPLPSDNNSVDTDPVLEIKEERGLVYITWEGAPAE